MEEVRTKIHRAVTRAIRLGLINKRPCRRCGDDNYIVAHHKDYGKPFDITFLCMRHHVAWHKKREAKPPPPKFYNLNTLDIFEIGISQLQKARR